MLYGELIILFYAIIGLIGALAASMCFFAIIKSL